jgi:hypothetical protein
MELIETDVLVVGAGRAALNANGPEAVRQLTGSRAEKLPFHCRSCYGALRQNSRCFSLPVTPPIAS